MLDKQFTWHCLWGLSAVGKEERPFFFRVRFSSHRYTVIFLEDLGKHSSRIHLALCILETYKDQLR